MTPSHHSRAPLWLKLPATSANLGPGFDALGLAMSLYLEVTAFEASESSLVASGRDAAVTGALEGNLMLATYREVLESQQRIPQPLRVTVHNQIPLGMGCGSSAAALCAGVLLANHFGDLGWSSAEVLDEAVRREGHPDNVAACLCGGMTASRSVAEGPSRAQAASTLTATVGLDLPWRLLLALPHTSLSTSEARQLLPGSYGRADAVGNIQATALLVAAFALDRPDLLTEATKDCFHQPHRLPVCPLLGALLPLAGRHGVLSVTLSGAGPSVLLIADASVSAEAIRTAAGDLLSELLEVTIAPGAVAQVTGG